MAYQVHLSPKSSNVKTGPIPVSTTTAATCPNSCGFKSAGCYAKSGPLALHWSAVTAGKRGVEWSAFCETISKLEDGALWRHNQAGDLPGDGESIDVDALSMLIEANAGKRGFTYTHYNPMTADNAYAVATANALGFTVNLSADSVAGADALADLGIGPVVCVLPIDQTTNTTTPAGRRVVVCPATVRDDVSCATCQLCQRQRETIIGFPAHGSGKRAADAVARRVINIKAI